MKPWYQSRTIWVNALFLVSMFLQQQFGYVFNAEAQLAVLTILNLFLRFRTDTAVTQ